MLNFILGGAGYGKSTKLIDIADMLSQNGKKVIFIVPEQFSFESDKKIYKHLGAKKFNNILSLSFKYLAKEIFEKNGGPSGEYAEDIDKFILMNKAVKELIRTKSLEYYSKQAKKPTFTNEALDIINEFRQCGISADKLLLICDKFPEYSEKINDLSKIYSTYAANLKDVGLKDSLTDISEAAAIASGSDYFKDCVIIFDEFESFTGDQYELIDVMFEQAEDIYIGLRLEDTENIGKNRLSVFEAVEGTWKKFKIRAQDRGIETKVDILPEPLRYKNDDLAFLNKNVMRNNKNVFEKSENISVIECCDLYEEAEFVCAQIKELVIRHGYKYSDIAVISRQLGEYVYIFDSLFAKYEIPYSMNIQKSAVHTRIMQYMINTVNIMCDENPSLEAVLTYIKTSMNGNSGMGQISMLENYSYEWGLEGKDFFQPFTLGIKNNPKVEEARQLFFNPIVELREKCRNADCKAICGNLYEFLSKENGACKTFENNNYYMVEKYNAVSQDDESEFYIKEKNRMIANAKEQKRIWDMLMTVLETFSDIGVDLSLDEFHRLFISAAENISFSVPPQTLDSVQVAKAETARLISPKAVFILGVNEGFFPPASRQSGLLSQKDRKAFEDSNVNLSRTSSELTADERLIVYKSLTYAEEKLYILYPQRSSNGEARFKATIINQICSMFGNNIAETASDRDIIFYSPTLQSAYSNYVRNLGKDIPYINELRTVLMEDEYYSAKIEYLDEVAKQGDFKISDPEIMRKIYSDRLIISPTAFEEYYNCHFKFFCDTGLKLKSVKKREIAKPERGSIVHKCFEEILRPCQTKQQLQALKREDIVEAIDKYVREYIDEFFDGNINARIEAMLENIKADMLMAVLHLQEELTQSQFRPVAFELKINDKHDKTKKPVPVLKLENGIEIILSGVVDRVDIYEKGDKKYVRVVDYKTGATEFSMEALEYGLNMQMLLYLFSITDINGNYNDCEPAGVLYMPSREIKNRTKSEENKTVIDYLNSHYKMNGVMLKELDVLKAMEDKLEGVYIPADTLESESCLSSKEFEDLKKRSGKLLELLAIQLYNGEIEAEPLVVKINKKDNNPCAYCEYWSICGNSSGKKSRSTIKCPQDFFENEDNKNDDQL